MKPEEAASLEFRATEDDAWYTVHLVLYGDWLIIKYIDFSEDHDEHFLVGDFKSLKDLDDFQKRFRPISVQLQDRDCHKAIEGLMVCASHLFVDDNSIRFYDACIEDVQYKEHSFAKGEEECLCTFLLFWQHGPLAGEKTICSIANICLIQPTIELDPTLAFFLWTMREKIETAMCNLGSSSKGNASDAAVCNGNTCPKDIASSCFSQYGIKETKRVRQLGRAGGTREFCERFEKNWGGEASLNSIQEASNHHFILIENLETDLSPSIIVEFMHKWISILPQAYIFPSLSLESYTKGIIVLDSKEDFETARCFLNNPDHIIISFRGRPWVTAGKKLTLESFKMIVESLVLKSSSKLQSTNVEVHSQLKIVKSGTEDYKVAEQLKDLYMDFADHLQTLHKKLALDEGKILQLSRAA